MLSDSRVSDPLYHLSSILISVTCSTLSIFSVGCQLPDQPLVFSFVLPSRRDVEVLGSYLQVAESLVQMVDIK